MKKITFLAALFVGIFMQSCSSHKVVGALSSRHLATISYRIENPDIGKIVESSSKKSLLKVGQRYNAKRMEKERQRLTKIIQNAGLKEFNQNYISFLINDNLSNNQFSVQTMIDSKN